MKVPYDCSVIIDPQKKNLVVIIAICLLLGIMALFAMEAAVDDAFIVFRYVERFLENKGLTYNDAEYVEGFTSISWTILLSTISLLLGIKPHIASILINYMFIFFCAFMLNYLLRILLIERNLRTFALIIYSISILYMKVVFLGLEFGFFTWLLLCYFCSFLRGIDYPYYAHASKTQLVIGGLLAAAIFATRPESLFLLPSSLIILCIYWDRNKKNYKHLLYILCPFLLATGLLVLWRLFYYGEYLPNSVIAKSIYSFDHFFSSKEKFLRMIGSILNGIEYIVAAYINNPALLLTLIMVIITLCKKKLSAVLIWIFIPVIYQHAVILENGGDWMPYFRFVTIYTPLYIIGFIIVIQEIFKKKSRMLAMVCIFTFLCFYIYGNINFLNLNNLPDPDRPIDKHHLYQAIGKLLNDSWIEGDILWSEAAGRIGYAAPRIYIHEPNGLMDKTLAKDKAANRSVYGRVNFKYSLGLDPAVIVIHTWPQQEKFKEFSLDYPYKYAFYCIPPLPKSSDNEWLHMIIRKDRVEIYEPELDSLGIKKIAFLDIQNLRGAIGKSCVSIN
jgi:hypothetical protein